MPRSTRRHPRGGLQVRTGASCLVPWCSEVMTGERVLDPAHWNRVPLRLKRAFLAAKAEGRDSAAFASALTALGEWARSVPQTAPGATLRGVNLSSAAESVQPRQALTRAGSDAQAHAEAGR